jgi:SNF2 family DNA or RNA helicase
MVFHGPGRSLDEESAGGGVVLTTYDIIFRSTAELSESEWEVAVFDEAQRIKNPRTKAARAARKIPANHRVALTGTPLENRLVELWSVVDLIVPGFLGSEREFRKGYRNPSHHQLHRLRQRLSVLTLRRLKGQVLSDLPDKVEDLRYCTMKQEQEELYRHIHGAEVKLIADQLREPGAEIPYMHIFALLTKLKQACDHPALVGEGPKSAGSSGKLEVFDQILDEALDGEHRVVVFSQYVKMVDFLSRYLRKRSIAHLILTGESRDRGRTIRRFNSEQHERVLLASLLAGGVGIDLTGASVVIHYDRWWNPAKENQATDRVHRIGQKRFVHVFKLITRNTIEERIDTMIRRKVELFEEVVTPTEQVVRGLDRRELAELLDIDLE